MTTTREIVLRFVGSGLIAIGALAAYGAVRMRIKVGQSHKWPTVPGEIVSSELEHKAGRHDGKRITTYAAGIRYAYEVDGKAYESDQINSVAAAKPANRKNSSEWSSVTPRGSE